MLRMGQVHVVRQQVLVEGRSIRSVVSRVGITTVRLYLAERRRQTAEVYVPLVHRAGDEVQVDFFDVTVEEDCRARRGSS